MNTGVWLSARITRASPSEASGLPPECYLKLIRDVFRTQDESKATNHYGQSDISAHDSVCDAWVDIDPHGLVLVDEDLFEECSV